MGGNSPDVWKLKNIFLNSPWEVKKNILNEMQHTKICDMAKAVLRGKFMH